MNYKMLGMIILIASTLSIPQSVKESIFDESFDILDESWKKISINGNDGEFEIAEGKLFIKNNNEYFGLYKNLPLAWHFIVDLEFKVDANIGLALFQNNNGMPDLQNFTMLCVDTKDGIVEVEVKDCQNGINDVLDFTGKTNFEFEMTEERRELNIRPDLYTHILTGDQYSVPFTETNKTIRIFREDNSDFFHYYYQVSKINNGKKFVDWMELRPSPDWAEPNTEYFIGIIGTRRGETIINNQCALFFRKFINRI